MSKSNLIIAAAFLLALAAASQAQMDALKNTTPAQRAAVQTELMKSKLDLKPDQIPKIHALNLKYAEKMEPIIQGSAGPFVMTREMRTINGEKEDELKQVLSPQQFARFLASRKKMREQFEQKLEEKAKE